MDPLREAILCRVVGPDEESGLYDVVVDFDCGVLPPHTDLNRMTLKGWSEEGARLLVFYLRCQFTSSSRRSSLTKDVVVEEKKIEKDRGGGGEED